MISKPFKKKKPENEAVEPVDNSDEELQEEEDAAASAPKDTAKRALRRKAFLKHLSTKMK